MPTFAIESDGFLENTAVYYNGKRLSGIKEIFLNMDEEGTFDAYIQYEGTDGETRVRNIFTEYLDEVKTADYTNYGENLNSRILEIESDGDIESSTLYYDDEPLEGVVRLFVRIKGTARKSGILSKLFGKDDVEKTIFENEIVFRNEDGSLEKESLF